MTKRCDSCGQPVPGDLEVLTEMLWRVMPRRIPTEWDARDLAEEALATVRALGWTAPSDP